MHALLEIVINCRSRGVHVNTFQPDSFVRENVNVVNMVAEVRIIHVDAHRRVRLKAIAMHLLQPATMNGQLLL